MELGELVLKQRQEDGVERRGEVHKQEPGICSRGVQMLEGVVQGHVYCMIYRPVGSIGELTTEVCSPSVLWSLAFWGRG